MGALFLRRWYLTLDQAVAAISDGTANYHNERRSEGERWQTKALDYAMTKHLRSADEGKTQSLVHPVSHCQFYNAVFR